ncbi:MAG: ABC transporter permease [Bilophila wadsworthia]
MRALFRYLLALAALLAIWQIGSLALGEFLLPRPLDVLAYFGEALTTGAFWQHAGASAWRVLSAMSLAWLVAFPLGLILGHVRSVDNTLSPMVFLTYPLPKIVLLPLFLTLFGLGDLPRVLLIALTTGYDLCRPRAGSTKNISIPSAPSAGRRCRCCGMCSSPPPCPTP